ncbi:cytochrome P450 [Streptomyces sp. NRRL WC-3742]|uniref:cytochrome P450 n=1 Tax=Streptomyces sp. NRRL WC-3742 TaxID=1463934 RepID=UPI0004C9D5F9|nr:cytochrome P450 [Streptomyces sp. NRRL WC-3742]
MTMTLSHRREAPGPAGYPLVKSGPDLVRDLVGTFTRAWRRYGDLVRFQIPGNRELFLIVDPDFIKHVLDDNQPNYPKDPLSVGKFEPWVGQGLFTSNGDFHFRQRRLAQPAFKGSRIAGFGPAMVDATGELVKEWKPAADEARTLDITPEMMRLALTIVMQTLFSTDVSTRAGDLARAVRICNAYTNTRLQRFVELPEALPSRARRQFLQARASLDAFVYGLIADRRRDSAPPDDLLTRFLTAQDQETGERMSDKQLRDEVVTMFLGGYETTALSLVWAFSLLSRHPETERRIRAEVAEVCGDREPAADDLPRLRYLRAFFQEVLRLYPSVWTLSRSPIEDDEIGGYRIPAGSQVFISPYLMHRHPAYWPNPEGFRPERFEKSATGGGPLYAYIPFSRGPRLCPGSSVAVLEAPLVIARILQSYRLTLAPGHVCEPTSNVFLYPRDGMPMRIQHVRTVTG